MGVGKKNVSGLVSDREEKGYFDAFKTEGILDWLNNINKYRRFLKWHWRPLLTVTNLWDGRYLCHKNRLASKSKMTLTHFICCWLTSLKNVDGFFANKFTYINDSHLLLNISFY